MLQSLDSTLARTSLPRLDHLVRAFICSVMRKSNPKAGIQARGIRVVLDDAGRHQREVTQVLMTCKCAAEADVESVEAAPAPENVQYHHSDYDEGVGEVQRQPKMSTNRLLVLGKKSGANDPCRCRSGKKLNRSWQTELTSERE